MGLPRASWGALVVSLDAFGGLLGLTRASLRALVVSLDALGGLLAHRREGWKQKLNVFACHSYLVELTSS